MKKFRISMDMDFSDIAPDAIHGNSADQEAVKQVFVSTFINAARAKAKSDPHKIRTDTTMDADVRTIRMAESIRQLMATMAAEANIAVTALDDDYVINTQLPFERQYATA